VLVNLRGRKLKPKPKLPPKPLKPYVAKTSACVVISDHRLSDETTDLLKDSPRAVIRVAKIPKERSRQIREARKMARSRP
jgi:hypothetical protein